MRSISGNLSEKYSDQVEILKSFSSKKIKNGAVDKWIGKYEITAWDSGTYILPEQHITIGDSMIYFHSIDLNVDLVKSTGSNEIFDIVESYTQLPPEKFSIATFTKKNWWWLSIVGVIVVLFALLYIRKNRKSKVAPEQELSLKERTLIAINSLEKEKLWEKERLKEHYIELSYILRSYLSARYSVNLLEKTSHETKLLLKQSKLENETIEIISTILNLSDMVKFAKSRPDELEILKSSQLAKQIVAETSPLEFENV